MILLWIPILIFVYIKMIDPGKKREHPVLNVKYYAHRGFHGEEGIPENSMAAFKKAKELGYGMELDVQLTKDNEIVVIHDERVDRTNVFVDTIECHWRVGIAYLINNAFIW